MKARGILVAFGFCAGSLLLCGTVLAQAKKSEPAKPAAAPAAKPADKPAAPTAATKPGEKPAAAAGGMPPEMEAMMKAAQPGEFHANLRPLAGKWSFVTKFRMSPDQPWEESTGKAEYKWTFGNRFLVEEVKANPSEKDKEMGGPFEGFGLMGYDNSSKKYFSTWIDNMSTGLMVSTGTSDSSGKTFTFNSDPYVCPMTGQNKTNKSILKIVGDDKVVFEMYDKGPDGKEFMSLEVAYTRQK